MKIAVHSLLLYKNETFSVGKHRVTISTCKWLHIYRYFTVMQNLCAEFQVLLRYEAIESNHLLVNNETTFLWSRFIINKSSLNRL